MNTVLRGELWVVMPAFDEEDAMAGVIDEWLPELRRAGVPVTLCVLNDGSRDRTLQRLRALETRTPELLVVDKPNSGHGQTCVVGYRLALEQGARWIFQIDSDGQCDPHFFPAFWSARTQHAVIYGFRRRRDDGVARLLISRVVSVVTLLATGVWVRDPNVPYRLMSREVLEPVVEEVPKDFHLANVLIAVLQQARVGIHWIDIGFRSRAGGTASVKPRSFARRGWQLYRQLRRARQAVVTDGAAGPSIGVSPSLPEGPGA